MTELSVTGEEKYLDRRMRMKQSMYKCADCERQAQHGHATTFLFPRTNRGNKCPTCGNNRVQKISISAVMENRWNNSVRFELSLLRGRALPSIPKIQV
jgi:DNA-directed RNA polymerase subunit RPC12/RpoP